MEISYNNKLEKKIKHLKKVKTILSELKFNASFNWQ